MNAFRFIPLTLVSFFFLTAVLERLMPKTLFIVIRTAQTANHFPTEAVVFRNIIVSSLVEGVSCHPFSRFVEHLMRDNRWADPLHHIHCFFASVAIYPTVFRKALLEIGIASVLFLLKHIRETAMIPFFTARSFNSQTVKPTDYVARPFSACIALEYLSYDFCHRRVDFQAH